MKLWEVARVGKAGVRNRIFACPVVTAGCGDGLGPPLGLEIAESEFLTNQRLVWGQVPWRKDFEIWLLFLDSNSVHSRLHELTTSLQISPEIRKLLISSNGPRGAHTKCVNCLADVLS